MRRDLIPQVRTSALQTYSNVARYVGLDPHFLLRKHRIRAEDLADPDRLIAAEALVNLYEDSAAASAHEDFGLLMAESRSAASLGPIALLLRYQPTVRAIIEQVVINMRLLNDIVQVRVDDDGRVAMIRVELFPGFGLRQTIESTVAIACRSYREFVAGAWQPESIHFRHSAPKDMATHRRVFGCPILFDSEFDGILCSTAALDVANPWADPAMAAHAKHFMDMLAERRPVASVTEQARQAIFLLISSGNATKEKIAENLALHPRSLQRLLSREDTNFGELLGEARRELAIRYLTSSKHSITDIALLLGYSTVSFFTRWFSEEFGMSPVAWRKARPQDVIAAVTTRAA